MARRKNLYSTYVDTIQEISPKCEELKKQFGENTSSLEINEMTIGGQRIFMIQIWG